jgi:probable F420-dependent oxidoreductase
MELTGVGVWSSQLRFGDPSESADAATELDELGFTALWIPDAGGPVFDAVGHLLAATRRTVIATGILNLWMHSAGDVAESYAALAAEHGDRFLLGIGVSHAPLIDAGQPGRYRKPLAATASFLDALDAADRPVPSTRGFLPHWVRKCWLCPRAAPAEPTPTWSPPSTPLLPVQLWARARCCCRSRP